MTTCEICNQTIKEEDFQKHLFENHDLLFCQYVGLITDKISFKEFLVDKKKKKTGK